MDGSVARTYDQNASVVKNNISSKINKRHGIGFSLLFLLAIKYIDKVENPKRITIRVSLVKGKRWRLPISHIRYEASKIPITFVKIYPRSINLRNIEVVTGRKIVPMTKIVSHQMMMEKTSDMNFSIIKIFPSDEKRRKFCYNSHHYGQIDQSRFGFRWSGGL